MRVPGLVTVAVAAVLLVGGCSDVSGSELGDLSSELLADGAVSEAEYRRAVDATTACLEEKGFTAGSRPADDGVLWTITVGGGSGTGDDTRRTEAAWDECYEALLFEVEKSWWWSHVPTGAERDAMMTDLLGCFEGLGIEGITPTDTAPPMVQQLADRGDDAVGQGIACLERYHLVFPDGMFGVHLTP